MPTFTERFEEICRGKTQDEVARLTGLGKATVHNYLHAQRSPGLNEAVKIAQTFNVSLDWLSGLTPYRTTDRDIATAAFTLNMPDSAIEQLAVDEYLAAITGRIIESEHGRAALVLMDAYLKTPPGSLTGYTPDMVVDLVLEDLEDDRNKAIRYEWDRMTPEVRYAFMQQAILTGIKDKLDAMISQSGTTV